MRPTADELNEHLSGGGVVQVTTYLKSWLYEEKHGAPFSESGGSLYVRHGRGTMQLSIKDYLSVGLRVGHYV